MCGSSAARVASAAASAFWRRVLLVGVALAAAGAAAFAVASGPVAGDALGHDDLGGRRGDGFGHDLRRFRGCQQRQRRHGQENEEERTEHPAPGGSGGGGRLACAQVVGRHADVTVRRCRDHAPFTVS